VLVRLNCVDDLYGPSCHYFATRRSQGKRLGEAQGMATAVRSWLQRDPSV
jgi:hypothetical protein